MTAKSTDYVDALEFIEYHRLCWSTMSAFGQRWLFNAQRHIENNFERELRGYLAQHAKAGA